MKTHDGTECSVLERVHQKLMEGGIVDVSAMEAIARQAPLSSLQRPAWDLDVLHGLGMQAAADTEVWKQVWTKEERINNASTPMFLVEARKCPLLQ